MDNDQQDNDVAPLDRMVLDVLGQLVPAAIAMAANLREMTDENGQPMPHNMSVLFVSAVMQHFARINVEIIHPSLVVDGYSSDDVAGTTALVGRIMDKLSERVIGDLRRQWYGEPQ